MFTLFSIIPKLLVIPISIYLYYYLKRILSLFKINSEKNYVKIMLVVISFIIVFPASYIWGLWALIIFHWIAFNIVIDILHFLFRKYAVDKLVFQKIYQSGIVSIFCVIIVLGYGYWNMQQVSIIHYTINTQKHLSQNYRIAFISDLHFGNTMNEQNLSKYCQEISAQNPDIVLLGGDIVDEKTTYQQMQQAFLMLSQIQSQYGIYYVYGNHDEAKYSKKPDFTSQQLTDTIKDYHITILLDEVYRIQDEFTLVGRQDRSHPEGGTRIDSKQLVEMTNQDDFLLMLDHQPVDLKINDSLKYDLQLSGHTHGGQIFPVGLISSVLGFGEMNYGYQQMDYLQVIVSSGIAGWGYPIRTGSHSEYVIVDIMTK